MSTRANIVIKDADSKLIFYKHSDGYPEGTLPLLETFLNRVKDGTYRDNVSQSAGNLILIGYDDFFKSGDNNLDISMRKSYSWKCGSIEPTTCIHGDIEYLYTIDLVKKTIKVKAV